MKMIAARLANYTRIAYSEEGQLLVIVPVVGKVWTSDEVPGSVIDKLLAADDREMAIKQIDAIQQLYPEVVPARAYRALPELAQMLASQAAKCQLRVTAHESPLPVLAYSLDAALERTLCERDADCSQTHFWIWVIVPDAFTGDQSDFIFHFDARRAVVVPPTPIEVLWG